MPTVPTGPVFICSKGNAFVSNLYNQLYNLPDFMEPDALHILAITPPQNSLFCYQLVHHASAVL